MGTAGYMTNGVSIWRPGSVIQITIDGLLESRSTERGHSWGLLLRVFSEGHKLHVSCVKDRREIQWKIIYYRSLDIDGKSRDVSINYLYNCLIFCWSSNPQP